MERPLDSQDDIFSCKLYTHKPKPQSLGDTCRVARGRGYLPLNLHLKLQGKDSLSAHVLQLAFGYIDAHEDSSLLRAAYDAIRASSSAAATDMYNFP